MGSAQRSLAITMTTSCNVSISAWPTDFSNCRRTIGTSSVGWARGNSGSRCTTLRRGNVAKPASPRVPRRLAGHDGARHRRHHDRADVAPALVERALRGPGDAVVRGRRMVVGAGHPGPMAARGAGIRPGAPRSVGDHRGGLALGRLRLLLALARLATRSGRDRRNRRPLSAGVRNRPPATPHRPDHHLRMGAPGLPMVAPVGTRRHRGRHALDRSRRTAVPDAERMNRRARTADERLDLAHRSRHHGGTRRTDRTARSRSPSCILWINTNPVRSDRIPAVFDEDRFPVENWLVGPGACLAPASQGACSPQGFPAPPGTAGPGRSPAGL